MKPSEVLQKSHDRLSVPGVWGKGPSMPEGCTCIALVTTQVTTESGNYTGREDLDADAYVCKAAGIPQEQGSRIRLERRYQAHAARSPCNPPQGTGSRAGRWAMKWKTRDGRELEPAQIEDKHLLNILEMLERQYSLKTEFYLNCRQPNGDMAGMAFDAEFSDHMDAGPERYWPIYKELDAEAVARKLRDATTGRDNITCLELQKLDEVPYVSVNDTQANAEKK